MTTSTSTQLELPTQSAEESVSPKNVTWLVQVLTGRDWMTAAELLAIIGLPATEDNKKIIRDIAGASKGKVLGHQKGYKLNAAMIEADYRHWRNEWIKSAKALMRRVVEADRTRYNRQPAAN